MAKKTKPSLKKAPSKKPPVARAPRGQQTKSAKTAKPDKKVIPMPSDEDVVAAIKKLKNMQADVQSASGERGEYIGGTLVEKKHFNKKALGIVRGIDAIPERNFGIVWKHVMKMAKALGFDDRADAQGELELEVVGKDQETLDLKTNGKTGNVTHIGKAARKVAEAAGIAAGERAAEEVLSESEAVVH